MSFLQTCRRYGVICTTAVFVLALPVVSRADADADWKKITALDAGPEGEAKTRDEALKLTLTQLALQEKALRAFVADYPRDPHGVEARMRLSHILAIRSDLENNPALYQAALKILDDLLASPVTPPEKLSDVAY